jgi:hypothetical protein
MKKDYQSIKIENEPDWSPSRILVADRCMKEYFFKYVLHEKQKTSASELRGSVMHNRIEKFWKRNKKGFYIPSFKSEESFANRVAGDLKMIAVSGEYNGRELDDSKGFIFSDAFQDETKLMAKSVYKRYIREGVCLNERGMIFPKELRINRKLELKSGRVIKLNSIIDELRPELTIRDHKIGYKTILKEAIENDIQFTHYLFSVFLELQDEKSDLKNFYSNYLGISLNDFLEVAKVEFHHVSQNHLPEEKREEELSQIYISKRNRTQVANLVRKICQCEDMIKRREFFPTTDNSACHFRCKYGLEKCIDVKPEEIIAKSEGEKNSLLIFSGVSSPYEKGCIIKPEIPEKPRQKTMRLMKKTNELRG